MQSTSTIQKLKSSLTYESIWRAIVQKSFYEFVKYFWDTIIAEEPVWNWHIKYLCNELQEIGERVFLKDRGRKDEKGEPILERLPKLFDVFIFNVPPGSSKSTIISEMYPIWCWTQDPTQRFICGSYASTPAEDIAEKCFNIYKSDKFKRLFPELVKEASGGKTHFKNGLKGERYTSSTGSAITGIHAHQKIIDDPMNPQIAASQLERTRANKWASETLGSRDVSADITVTILVMQRLHQMDTTGYYLSKASEGLRIKHICIPAELSDNIRPSDISQYYVDGLFDPVRFPKTVLIKKKTELGSYGYAGQMAQRPSPEEGGIIKKQWLQTIQRPPVKPNEIGRIVHFQMDTAYTEKQSNDPTAILAYYLENNFLYVSHVQSVWKEFPDLIKWLPEYVKSQGYDHRSKIYVEPKASGKSVVQQLKKTSGLNIVESVAPKDDKLTRAHLVSPKIEVGRIILHEGPWNDHFINQVISFPNAEHDDEWDCLIEAILRELKDKQSKSNGGFFSGMP